MMIKFLFVLFMISFTSADPGDDGNTVYVSNDCTAGICEDDNTYPTIQDALNALTDVGGIVILQAGEFVGEGNKNLEVMVPVTFKTVNLPNTEAVVDCEGSGYGFKVDGKPIMFEGFTIANCIGDTGAAINVSNGISTTLVNMVLLGNIAAGNGGAVSVLEGTLEVTNSNFVLNNGDYGGAVFIFDVLMNVVNTAFTDNVFADGGVIGCTGGGTVQIDDDSTINNEDEAEMVAKICNECSLNIGGVAKCGNQGEPPTATPPSTKPPTVPPPQTPQPPQPPVAPPVTPPVAPPVTTPVAPPVSPPFSAGPFFGAPSSASTVVVNGVLLVSAIILGTM